MASHGDGALKRGLGPLEAITLVVGGTIGASIFLVPSAVAREVGSPGLALSAWLLTGFMALCGALSFAELAEYGKKAKIEKRSGKQEYLNNLLNSYLFG